MIMIVTTPMCEKILEFLEIANYKVNKDPDLEEGDLNVLMSENKSQRKSIILKLNTFDQIMESIKKIDKYSPNYSDNSDFENKVNEKIASIFSNYKIASKWIDKGQKNGFRLFNSKFKIKVYSNFLTDIVEDMGFKLVNSNVNADFIVFPDYFDIKEIKTDVHDKKLIKIPSHGNVSKDPIKRTEKRYLTIEKSINENIAVGLINV